MRLFSTLPAVITILRPPHVSKLVRFVWTRFLPMISRFPSGFCRLFFSPVNVDALIAVPYLVLLPPFLFLPAEGSRSVFSPFKLLRLDTLRCCLFTPVDQC